jgi:hypothetical protein
LLAFHVIRAFGNAVRVKVLIASERDVALVVIVELLNHRKLVFFGAKALRDPKEFFYRKNPFKAALRGQFSCRIVGCTVSLFGI